MQTRCPWAGNDDEYIAYHDHEWGVPVHDDHKFFEFLILEGAQAGLSWQTILRKRENYRRAFAAFDPVVVAVYDEQKIGELLLDAGLVRNRLKINSAVRNAREFVRIQEEFGSFDSYIWDFVGGRPIVNEWESLRQVPAETPGSRAISKDLKKRGFSFVGPTIIYAFMQATGIVNDHLVSCFRHAQVMAEN
ncbi:MAG TPA: DNA-3-methyladenine glycosylase I [Promineifilum sp.]|nr:DNA-3-methyladenine glycosylase I [Promineifilum sp.]HRO89018.1 DNA-3-methyladenine glycosylase I [Promineifilum sp.]HRQ13515.1 DNA-3-methyladenine glycosylase I [Promineifilum sp.]